VSANSLSLSNQSGCRAYLSATITVNQLVSTTITFNTEVYDRLNEFNPATGTFTSAGGGLYAVYWNLFQTTSQTTGVNQYFIGTTAHSISPIAAVNQYYADSATIRLAAGGTMKLDLVQSFSSTISFGSGTGSYIMIEKIN
jgi:hypothetical protein